MAKHLIRAAIGLLGACAFVAACGAESEPSGPTQCDGTEQCIVGEQGACSPCCCPVPGTRYELSSDRACKRQVLEGTLECYARAGSIEDFPDVCGGAAATLCLQRTFEGKLQVQQSPYIPIGWSASSDWESCSDDVAGVVLNADACE